MNSTVRGNAVLAVTILVLAVPQRWVCAAEPAPGDDRELLVAHFASEPADSLVRQLDAAVSPNVGGGLTLRRQATWLPDPGVVLLDSELINAGNTPAQAARVPLGQWTFRVAEPGDGTRYQPLSYRNDTWYGSTYWTGPDWTRVGLDWHHPGENTPSVRRFTAPADGKLTVAGRVYKAHLDGDGVRVLIRHNDQTVWQAEIEGKDDKGLEPNLTLDVRKGDAIRFVVHKRGQIYCDTTRWDPIVTYSGGQSFRGSQGFSTEKQGSGGWSYEMEADASNKTGLPTVYALGLDGALRTAVTGVDQSVACSDSDTLPLLVLADGRDESGVALAIAAEGPWQFGVSLSRDGRLQVGCKVPEGSDRTEVLSGKSLALPRLALGAYRGSWLVGVSKLNRLLGSAPEVGFSALRERVTEALRHVSPLAAEATPELDFWAMIQAEWQREDKLAQGSDYAAATARHLDKTRALIACSTRGSDPAETASRSARVSLRSARVSDPAETADRRSPGNPGTCGQAGGSVGRPATTDDGRPATTDDGTPATTGVGRPATTGDAAVSELEQLTALAARPNMSLDDQRAVYLRTRWLKRHVLLSNPLMDFGQLLFAKRVPTSYSHLVMQYFGWRARPGGGLFVLERPGRSLAARNLLDGKLAGGNVLEPRLAYDAERIIFSFTKCTQEDPFYHIYEVRTDGSNLRQLTDGEFEDLMPNYLPDGGIVFSSTRRKGHARCFGGQFGPRWHVYTLHRMDADGSNIRTLSFHETNEWFPTVAPTGHILYSRWDYVDRHPVVHQNLWACRPDGTNPVALWGNHTETPHCTFQLQPIPNTTKIVFTASAHHSITGGSVAIVAPHRGNNGEQALTRITPEVPFPEAEGRINEYYDAPWPLSEDLFLVGYSPRPLIMEPQANDPAALGIYLLDRHGNRELIYRDPTIGSSNPIPLVPRPLPPILPSMLPADAPPTGELVMADVYQGLGRDIPRGSIKALRIVQILPKTTPVADGPRVGLAGQEPTRAVLGTVPVEPDGSARFVVPAHKPILFQALDQDGLAYQTMRSITYLQPGETVACIGCHERRSDAPIPKTIQALQRPASQIEPGPDGTRPFSYVRLVQPILDQRCVRCHGGEKVEKSIDLTGKPQDGFTRSYWALCGKSAYGSGSKEAAESFVPRYGGWNSVHLTTPGGAYGARGSRLLPLLQKRHADVELSRDELARIALWIDCNSVFYGVYDPAEQARQLAGEIVALPEVQ